MRLRLGILLLLWMVFSVTLAHAQGDDTWYWAIGNQDGTFYAYTPSGESHALLESGVEPGNTAGWRFKPDTSVAILKVNDVIGLYHLTPETVQSIQLPPELSEENNGSIDDTLMAAHSGDFGVLVSTSPISAPALLVNLKTDQASWLTGEVSGLGVNRHNIVFSADGRYLRYLSHAEGRSTEWSIIERKLETGDERTIHTLEADPFAPVVWADPTGENWLYLQTPQQGQNTLTYTLVTPSGIDREVASETRESGKVWGMLGDKLVTYSLLCEADCPIEVRSLEGGDSLHFQLAVRDSGSGFQPLELRDNGDLVLMTGDTFWQLSSDGSSQQLGARSPQYSFTPISPDGRWLSMFDDAKAPTKYQVWDTQTGQFVFTGSWDRDDHILITSFGAGGFLVSEDALRYWLYRYSDGATVELPSEDMRYFAVLADSTLLAFRFKPNDTAPLGIYHYDPATKSETLLLPDRVAMSMQE